MISFFSHVGRIYGAQLHERPNPMPETIQIQMVTMGFQGVIQAQSHSDL